MTGAALVAASSNAGLEPALISRCQVLSGARNSVPGPHSNTALLLLPSRQTSVVPRPSKTMKNSSYMCFWGRFASGRHLDDVHALDTEQAVQGDEAAAAAQALPGRQRHVADVIHADAAIDRNLFLAHEDFVGRRRARDPHAAGNVPVVGRRLKTHGRTPVLGAAHPRIRPFPSPRGRGRRRKAVP